MVSAAAARIGDLFIQGGIVDFVLPFLLVFTLIFAILQKSELFKHKVNNVDVPNKNVNVAIALVIGLIFVIPHITSTYPQGYDPVNIINQSLPGIGVVIVASLMMLIMVGLFGREIGDSLRSVILFTGIGFIIYIFGASLNWWGGPSNTFSWWTSETTELAIIFIVFGLIVYFITREPKPTTTTTRNSPYRWENFLGRQFPERGRRNQGGGGPPPPPTS